MYCPRHAWKWLSGQSHHHKWLAPWKIWSVEEPVTLLVGTKPRTSHCRSPEGVRHGKRKCLAIFNKRKRKEHQSDQRRNLFLMTNSHLQQTRVCCNKSKLVVTKPLLQQNYVCCDKSFLTTKICLCLSQQNICHDNSDTCGSSHQWQKICMLCFVIINSVPFNLLCVFN